MSTLEKAIAIAARVHEGQIDKAGEPYILHPLRVMMRVTDPRAKIVAILHDVVEDSAGTELEVGFDELRAEGFGNEIVAALDCVTKRDGEAYDDFVRRSASDPIAREVKLADLEDNMNMLRLKTEMTPKDLERLEKYHRAWRFLTSPGN